MAVGGGQVGPPGPAGWPSTRPPAIFDIRDYGAIVRETSGASLPPAFEAARVDMAAYIAANVGCGAALKIPAGRWFTKQPIFFDLDYAKLQGDGKHVTTIESVNAGAFPPIITGVSRAPNGVTLTSDHWIDLNGKMDFATTTSMYYGFRTKANAHIVFWDSPWNSGGAPTFGDGYWTGVPQVTFDFTIDWLGVAASSVGTTGIWGMTDQSSPQPFSFDVANSSGSITYYFKFVLTDGLTRVASFGLGAVPASGIHKISVQVDTIGGKVLAFVGSTNANRKQRAVSVTGGSFNSSTNLRFRLSEAPYPFLVGGLSKNAADPQGVNSVVGDFAIYGFQIYRGLLYADTGTDTNQTRLDAAGINDTNTSVSNNANVICWMANSEASPRTGPNGLFGGRLVRYLAGPASTLGGIGGAFTGYGLALSSKVQFNSNYNIFGNTIERMTLKTVTGAPYGSGLCMGGNFALRLNDLECLGGYCGLSTLWFGGQWPTWISDVRAQGYDCSFKIMGVIGEFHRLDAAQAGTTAFRFGGSVTGTLKGCFINDQNSRGRVMFYCHWGDGAQKLRLEDITIDNEGFPYPTDAVFRIEANKGGTSIFSIRNVYTGTVGKPGQAAIVQLVDNVGGWPAVESNKVQMTVEEIFSDSLGDRYSTLVVTDGPAFAGVLRDQSLAVGAGPILNTAADGRSRIASEHTAYQQPPRSGWWYAGSHTLNVPQAALGLYSRFYCTQSGCYGTATKPAWVGVEPIKIADTQIGGYTISEDYITGTLSVA